MMMMMMKKPVILVTCLFCLSFITVLASETSGSFGSDKCCFKFTSNRLPVKKVVSVKYTDTLCSMEGVLITMRNGVEICADPAMPWVSKIIEAKLVSQPKKVGSSTTTTSHQSEKQCTASLYFST